MNVLRAFHKIMNDNNGLKTFTSNKTNNFKKMHFRAISTHKSKVHSNMMNDTKFIRMRKKEIYVIQS